ncbi:LuxR family transcriptional regulator [Arthrobacter frigidicola]|nr:LuxR family transcriptional regulator [Arthrobacter frigidicola]
MTPLLPGSFFIGRTELLAGIQTALRREGSSGAVLVGGTGVGKTALLQQVLQSASGVHIVNVRGSAASRRIPYRALSFLLSEVEREVLGNPVMVLQALSAALRRHARGESVIIAVDNAEQLDAASSGVISQLVQNGDARILLAVKDFALADGAFMAMWCDGSLQRFDVPPLTFDESTRFVEAELGAPASQECLQALWEFSAGNPRVLRTALRGMARRNLLARSNGSWVLLPGRLVLGEELAEAGSALPELSREQRRIVRLTALAGHLPWPMALKRFSPEDLDTVQEARVISVDHGPAPAARCTAPALADAVAESVPAEEAGALYADFASQPGFGAVLEAEPTRHAQWLLRAGLPLPPEVALAGARSANRAGDFAAAAEIAASGKARSVPAALVLESVIADLGQGDFERAASTAAALAGRPESPAGADLFRLRLLQARILRQLGQPGSAALLDRAAAGLAGEQPLPEAAELRKEALLARAEQASWDGRFLHNAAELPAVLASDDGLDAEFRARVEGWLCEAWAMTARQLEAMELATDLARRVGGPGISGTTRTFAVQQIGEVYRLAGSGAEGERMLAAAGLPRGGPEAGRGSWGAVAEGVAEALQGRVGPALELLAPALNQLRVRDPQGLLPLAAAGITYCHAQERNLEQAIAHLPVTEAGPASPWKVRRASRHLQLLVSSLLEVKADAARDLHALGEVDRRAGAGAWALLSLSRAVRLGDRTALDPLTAVSASLQGAFARTCELYAKGLGNGDAELLVQAAELASAQGDRRFASDAAQAALRSAAGTREKNTLRQLQRRVREILPEAAAWSSAGSGLERLTAREREVTRLAAAGASNKAIAAQMFVSVRTVEGHLYQVYSKLNVSTRSELGELIPTETRS